MGNEITDGLPVRTGKPTYGKFTYTDPGTGEFTTIYLKSGMGEPGRSLKNDPNIKTDAQSWTHVEGHVASIMRQTGIKELTVRINYPKGPCQNCKDNVPKYLPPGGKLHVEYIEGGVLKRHTIEAK